jgi:hypothetical protein
VSAFVLLLFFQPFTEYLGKEGLVYIFNKNVNITKCRLTHERFDLYATLDHNQSLALEIKNIMHSNRQATLYFKGNINLFSHIATVELPHIEADAKAIYKGGSEKVSVFMNALDGKIYLDLYVDKMEYKYSASDVAIESYLLQNNLPIYAKGPLFINGKGVIHDDYHVDYNLTSHEIFLENKVVSKLPFKEIDSPLPMSLTATGSYCNNKINIKLDTDTSIAKISIPSFIYDINQSIYKASAKITNKSVEEIPFKTIIMDTEISASSGNYDGKVKLTVDEFVLQLDNIDYCTACDELKADYRFSTLSKKPLNLMRENELFGNIYTKKRAVSVTLNMASMKKPALFSLKNDKLSFISNNIQLETVLNILNQPSFAKADISLDLKSDLNKKPLTWNLNLNTQNLYFDDTISHELNITHPTTLNIEVKNRGDNIDITPSMISDIATLKQTLLKYNTRNNKLDIALNLFDIKLPYYAARHMNIDAAADLNSSSMSAGRIRTDFETINIDKLNWLSGKVKSDLSYSLKKLDRFAKLDGNYTLSGHAGFEYENGVFDLDMDSDRFGKIKIYKKGDKARIKAAKLPLKELFAITSTPTMLNGNIKASLLYSPAAIHAKIHSGKITPTSELNSTLRSFYLESDISLENSGSGSEYFGKAYLKTANEQLILKNINVKTDAPGISADYELNITDLQKATLLLPEEFQGKLDVNGSFLNDKIQKFSLNTQNFNLPEKWHRYLDANASGTLKTGVTLDVKYENGQVELKNTSKTDIISIEPLHAGINTKERTFELKCSVLTDLWQKDMNISLHGSYDDNMSICLDNSSINTSHQRLTLKKFNYNSSKDISGDFELKLLETDDPLLQYHKDAYIEGGFHTFPELNATLSTGSFDGKLEIEFNEKDLNIEMEQLSIPLLLAFAGKNTPLQSGKIDAAIKLSSQALLDNNMTTLTGTTNIHASDLLIYGVDLDAYLKHLRESQDLSLFNKDFKDLPIVRSVKDVPSTLDRHKVKATSISHIQANTIIQSGYLSCDDCAMSTERNLMAFQGSVDLNSKRFSDFYIGLLNPAGCAYFIQQIEGDLGNPELKLAAAGFKVFSGAVVSVASNVTDAAKWGTNAIEKTGSFIGNLTSYVPVVGGVAGKSIGKVTELPSDATGKVMRECEPFYNGTVEHPKIKKISKTAKKGE